MPKVGSEFAEFLQKNGLNRLGRLAADSPVSVSGIVY
jgi:hypothetical protein